VHALATTGVLTDMPTQQSVMDCVTRKREYGCIVLFCLHLMQALHVAGGCIERYLHLLVGWRRRYDEACVHALDVDGVHRGVYSAALVSL